MEEEKKGKPSRSAQKRRAPPLKLNCQMFPPENKTCWKYGSCSCVKSLRAFKIVQRLRSHRKAGFHSPRAGSINIKWASREIPKAKKRRKRAGAHLETHTYCNIRTVHWSTDRCYLKVPQKENEKERKRGASSVNTLFGSGYGRYFLKGPRSSGFCAGVLSIGSVQ